MGVVSGNRAPRHPTVASRAQTGGLADELLELCLLLVSDTDRPTRFAPPVDVPRRAGPSDTLVASLGRRSRWRLSRSYSRGPGVTRMPRSAASAGGASRGAGTATTGGAACERQ